MRGILKAPPDETTETGRIREKVMGNPIASTITDREPLITDAEIREAGPRDVGPLSEPRD